MRLLRAIAATTEILTIVSVLTACRLLPINPPSLPPLDGTPVALSTTDALPLVKASWLDIILQGIRVVQISNMSESEEIELGKEINQQIVQDVSLYDNPALTRYVDDIGQQLAQGVERPNIPYVFQLVEDNDINAFATLGGFVYINTGLICSADNEAQLASTLGHEMGHVDRRHVVERMKQAAIAEGILTAGGLSRNDAVAIGVDLALHRPNSRADELEADSAGVALLTQANYAPIAAIDFLEKLAEQSNGTPEFLSTHPHPEARISALRENIDPATATLGRGLNEAAYRHSPVQQLCDP